MRRIAPIVATLLFTCAADAQTPIVRARLSPETGILVGQAVRLSVTVLVPNYFTGSPDFPELEMENAIVVLPQDRPQNSNESIGGKTYAGITEVYTIYPQQPGDFELPHAVVTVPYASAPPKTMVAQVAFPVLSFHAAIPAAAANLDYFLPTTQLTIQQKWSVPLKNLRAGDAVQRTITVTATKMQAMLIPPLPFTAPDEIRVYPEQPVVQDQKTATGDFILGRRIESVKYFIQKDGDYTLPPIELQWWNLSTNRLVTTTLPAVHFHAAANVSYRTELPPELEPVVVAQLKPVSVWIRYRFWIRVVAPICLALLVFGLLMWFLVPRVSRILREHRIRRKQSEAAYFGRLERACRRNHAMDAYVCFLQWLRRAYPGKTVHEFLSGAADPAMAAEFNNLGAMLFAAHEQQPAWNHTEMAKVLREHRRKVRMAETEAQQGPALNP
jgi:BatD DUF11 like domain